MSAEIAVPSPLPSPVRDVQRLRDDLDRHGYCLVDAVLGAGERQRVADTLTEPGRANRKRAQPGDRRQLRNFTLGLPPDVRASLSDEMRSLLGFRLWESYGATDDYDVEFARPGYESAR